MIQPPGSSAEDWAVLRRRMIRETERFLEEGLLHPERCVTIPAVKDGTASFTRRYADVFWAAVLASS